MKMSEPDPDPKRARGRPRTMDADKVLDAAVAAYWRDDPADVSLNAVCRLAGVSKPSVYRAFGGEDGLMRAALDVYAQRVLADIADILKRGDGLGETLEALIALVCTDPRMETGCLFCKLRAGRHRLGPETRARVDKLNRDAQAGYAAFLRSRREAGEGAGGPPIELGARYLAEQLALAMALRASGEDPARIREMLRLAFSVFTGDAGGGPR